MSGLDPRRQTWELVSAEVEETLALIARWRAAPVPPSLREPLPAGSDEAVARLEALIEDLRARLSSQSARLESELRWRDRLRERVAELTASGQGLERALADLRRESSVRAERAAELEKTLETAKRASTQLAAAVDYEKSQAALWKAQAGELQARLEAASPAFDKQASELKEAHRRHDELIRTVRDDTTARVKEVRLLTAELERLRAREAELEARLESARRAPPPPPSKEL